MVWTKLTDICDISIGDSLKSSKESIMAVAKTEREIYPIIGSVKYKSSAKYNRDGKYIIKYDNEDMFMVDGKFMLIGGLSFKPKINKVNIQYLLTFLNILFTDYKDLELKRLKKVKIDLPSIDNQNRLVERLVSSVNIKDKEKEVYEIEIMLNNLFVPDDCNHLSDKKFSDYFSIYKSVELPSKGEGYFKHLTHNPERTDVSSDYNVQGESIIFDQIYRVPVHIDKQNRYDFYKNKMFQLASGKFKIDKTTAVIQSKTDVFSTEDLYKRLSSRDFLERFYTLDPEHQIATKDPNTGEKLMCYKFKICMGELENSRIFLFSDKDREILEEKKQKLMFEIKKYKEEINNSFAYRFRRSFFG